MKKVILSTLAALTLTTSAAVAGEPVEWYSNASKLKFSGLTYLGYTNYQYDNTQGEKFSGTPNGTYDANKDLRGDSLNKFEMRRAYIQVKAYLLEDPKSYFRVTLDMEHVTSDATAGDYNVRFKYAYLYLNEILPYTGVELGIAHRPWIDYEEHNSWFYRDTHWVFTEADNSAKLSNSADIGFNLKTKTEYFSSEIGMFSGEGYHNVEDGKGLSLEWRATGHLLGKHKKDAQNSETYWDASFFGQYNKQNNKYTQVTVGNPNGNQDLVWGGLHTVFNVPAFMIAAQYIQSQDTMDGPDIYKKAGKGYNGHAVFRFGDEKQFRVVGRYDSWTSDQKFGLNNNETLEKKTYYAGFVWAQNKNVQWVANYLQYDNDITSNGDIADGAKANSSQYMLTAQLSF